MDSRTEPTKAAAATGGSDPCGLDRWLLALRWRELWLDQVEARLAPAAACRPPEARACLQLLDAILDSLPEPLPAPLAEAAYRLRSTLPRSTGATLGREELQQLDRVIHDLCQWLIAPLRDDSRQRRRSGQRRDSSNQGRA